MTRPLRPSRPAPAPKRLNKVKFWNRAYQFAHTKAQAEALTKLNEGDKAEGTLGLKKELLAEVLEFGERDEKGSAFIYLDEPIDVPGGPYKIVKAQAANKTPYLDKDKAVEFLTGLPDPDDPDKTLFDSVKRYTYGLILTEEESNKLHAWLGRNELAHAVASAAEIVHEDAILALQYTGKLTQEQVDGIYVKPDPTYSFILLAK